MTTIGEAVLQLRGKVKGPVTVVVGRKESVGGRLDVRKLSLAADAAAAFRRLCLDAVGSLDRRTAVAYDDDTELKPDEAFVFDDVETLDELADLRGLASRASTLPVSAKDLDLSIQLYAVVVGDAPRAVFVRRVDPSIRSRAGGFLAIAESQLRRLDTPAFSFAPGFDLVLFDGWAVVCNQIAFERLYRDIGLVERHVDEWIRGITDHLPMAADSVAALRDVARRDSRTWRKLREIRRRGHLADVELDDVRRYARRVGLDAHSLVRCGELVFDRTERFSFLHLLNEDLYRGPLTDETFEAQRKARAAT